MTHLTVAVPWEVVDPWPDKTAMTKDAQSTVSHESSAVGTFDLAGEATISPTVAAQPRANCAPSLSSPAIDTNFMLPREAKRLGKHFMTYADYKSAKNADLFMIHAVEFELVKGDTMVYVDLPNVAKDKRSAADCDGIAYRSQRFRVHSEKLLATGSARFTEMLGPSYQFRMQRRRKLVNKLPEGVKYVLDLTPPSEGDDLVFQMTEASLTPGIMSWWTSHRIHGCEFGLVAGHDDVCSCKRQPLTHTDFEYEEDDKSNATCPQKSKTLGTEIVLPPATQTLLKLKAANNNKLYETPEFRNIPDYCPFRHRNSIIRLLILLEGGAISLNSAARVWTLVAVAKILDCTSVVRDKVAQWILQDRNARFVEVLPEEALKIGYDLQLQDITQTAFRILVNEMALEEAADNKASAAKRPLVTVFGRRKGECSDEQNNLIQHAARALVERVALIHTLLLSECFFDQWAIGEWSKLRSLEALLLRHHDTEINSSSGFSNALDKLRSLMTQLTRTIRHNYDRSTNKTGASYAFLAGMDTDRATYVLPMDFEELKRILATFNDIQRLLCPFVYNDLGDRCDKILLSSSDRPHGIAHGESFPALLEAVESSLDWLLVCCPELAELDDWKSLLHPSGDAGVGTKTQLKKPIVNLLDMEIEVKVALQPLTLSWVRHYIEPPANITRHLLLTLDRNEMKFLPLWAGGLDDGTGGVFEDQIPLTDMGPNGPGPAYHTGHTIPSAAPSVVGSLAEDISNLSVGSTTTTDGSIAVQDGISTVYRTKRVIVDDKSLASESFTTDESDYQDARFMMPQDHQGMGEAVVALVDSPEDDKEQIAESSGDEMSDSESSVVFIRQGGNSHSDSQG